MKMLLAVFISMTIFTSCTQTASTAEHKNIASPLTIHDVSYGKDSAQIMDIYLPANRSMKTTKSIILIHGGGWNGGSKSDLNSYIDSFKRRMPDYAIFNINYRLAGDGNIFPSQENDVRSAVNFIVHNSKDYGVNENKIVLLGASAGGHLALLQAYKYQSPKVAAVIDFFGPSNLEAMYDKPWHPLVPVALQMITGATPQSNPDLYRQSSPVNFVNIHSAPTLIFHGGKDQVVNISQSKSLKWRLDSANVSCELVVYPNERHGWYGSKMTDTFNRIESFLAEHVN
jgi:acetyl esterase/lipase